MLLQFFGHYLDPRNTFFGALLCLAGLSCGLYFSFTCLLSIPLNTEIYSTAVLGVTGFGLLKFIESRTRRHNTMCRLEVELNHAMDAVSILLGTLKKMIETQIPVLLPHDLPYVSIELVKQVGRIDVKNNLANLLCDFRRINQDWNNLVEFGKRHEEAITDHNHPQHRSARLAGTNLLTMVFDHTKSTFSLIKETLLLIRVYIRKDHPFFRFGQPFTWPCKMKKEIELERKTLESELHSNHERTVHI